jgi:hypothetical protein
MLRTKYAVIAGVLAAASANAGQIQIGGVNGLTSSYVGAGAGGWSETKYGNVFSSLTTSTPGLPTKKNTTLVTGSPGPQTFVANGITFSAINDPVASAADYQYAWISQNGGAPGTITVPVNVYGVQNVYLMLNDYAGYAGLNTTIAFNFASGTDTILLADLINGTGPIRSAVQCTSVTGPSLTCPSTTPNGNTVSASAPSATSTTFYGDASIVRSNVWTGTYTQAASPTYINDYVNHTDGSSGNLMLDQLAFTFFTDYSTTVLNSISITPPSVGGVTPGTQNDRLALSAITVSGANAATITSTPEPSAVMLFSTGLGLLGLGRLRTRKRKA